ncbi:response regulator transcription factor [uncultured Ornithinimicrobium sp.]|jgi:DNA-binding response OmpR family regulator|uniref:response regulator transcription factor n=1 Tax=uncultured Ornithinimicrobium sp. TaxID=259307 RepID=UPI0025996352|nr:response regulator transcription factor [uncultured Ornithinimicrobium sp.]
MHSTTQPDAQPPPTKVLVVDDEQAIAQMVGTYLSRAGYDVSVAHTGTAAVSAARAQGPAVLVLDLGLPGLDGIEVCRQVRTFSDCYILMLTARGDEMDRVIGLSVGADDYITKPFSARELVARVQAVLRRPRGPAAATASVPAEESPRTFGDLTVRPGARQAVLRGQVVPLTRTEFDILEVLSRRPSFAFSRRTLVDQVWDPAWVGDEHIVDVHIAHLRRKLDDDPADPRFIETVRGVGYRMGQG